SIGLSLRYRTPVVIAWSTPGAALLITSLPGVPYGEAIGAFIFASALIALCGLTGSFERLMRRVPASLAAALLAGVLFNIGIEIFRAVEVQPVLVLGMFFSYLLAKRLLPRYAVLCALLVGCLIAGLSGLLDFQRFSLQVAAPVWTTPSLSFAAIFSIGIPLFVIGIASVLLAPFGSHGIHLAAITMAICAGPEAHPDRSKRYTAAVWCGVFYGIAGIFGATLAALFAAFPAALVLSIAALALLGSIG